MTALQRIFALIALETLLTIALYLALNPMTQPATRVTHATPSVHTEGVIQDGTHAVYLSFDGVYATRFDVVTLPQ